MTKTTLAMVALICVVGAKLVIAEQPFDQPQLIVCDVDQGDAILITAGSWQMLLDGGPDDAVLSCLAQYMPFWDRTIELVVATHPDKDHIGGLQAVLERFRTPVLVIEWSEKESTDFEALKALISRKQASKELRLIQPTRGQLMQLSSGLQAEVLSPMTQLPEGFGSVEGGLQNDAETSLWDKNQKESAITADKINYNDRSIVLLLRLGATSVMLTGDLEYEGEQALLRQGVTDHVDILKVGHHGSKTSTSRSFLEAVRPEVAVISVGKMNTYGHPSPEVIDRLQAFSAKIYSTAESGDVRFALYEDGFAVFP